MKVQLDILTPFQKKPPGDLESISPASLKAYPRQILEAYPLQSMDVSPEFYSKLFLTRAYNWVILSLLPRKIALDKFFLSPTEFIKVPQRNLSIQSPARESSGIQFPSEFKFQYPQRSKGIHQQASPAVLI